MTCHKNTTPGNPRKSDLEAKQAREGIPETPLRKGPNLVFRVAASRSVSKMEAHSHDSKHEHFDI